MAAPDIVRAYKGSDVNLLQEANVNKILLDQNLALFTAEDPTMDAAFVLAYEADIAVAEVADSDRLVHANIATKTAAVKDALKSADALMRQVKYYVGEAFPGSASMHYAFGIGEWKKVRRSQVGVMQHLRTLHAIAEEHAAPLAAVGFGPDRVAHILTVHDAVEAANSIQEVHKGSRRTQTAERIGKYNAVYARMMRVNALARIVFREDYTMRKQFVFSVGSARRKKDEVDAA